MRTMRVTTWNVLHRVHALNWREPTIEAFPDERARAFAVAERVGRWLEDEEAVVALQEVSGDLLARLRSTVRGLAFEVRVHDHSYPRVPRARREGHVGLEDVHEHLVVLTRARSDPRSAHTFESDPGKGLLCAMLEGDVAVIDTHLSAGDRRAAQLATLRAAAMEAAGGAIVLGDFNALADVVWAGLGEGFVVSRPSGKRTSRPGAPPHPGATIDHVVVRGGAIVSAEVLDGGKLSDHDPVTAVVRFGA